MEAPPEKPIIKDPYWDCAMKRLSLSWCGKSRSERVSSI